MKFKLLIVLSMFLFTALLNSEPVQPFSLPDINNENVNISEFMGDNLIVLDFWASWCAPCMRLLPELDKIDQDFDNVKVITISIDNPRSVSRAKSLIRSQRYNFLTLFDTDQEIMKRFQVTSVPHTFLIDMEGKVVYEHTGYTRGDEEKLIAEIQRHLSQDTEQLEAVPVETVEE